MRRGRPWSLTIRSRTRVTLTNLTGLDCPGLAGSQDRAFRWTRSMSRSRGAGVVHLSGSVDRQDARMSGAGCYQTGEW